VEATIHSPPLHPPTVTIDLLDSSAALMNFSNTKDHGYPLRLFGELPVCAQSRSLE
jgi:hypothetical protein